MRIELSEILACPRCGPEQGVVLLVEESRERRVLDGRLGCPECDGRYPVSEGMVDLSAGSSQGVTVAATTGDDDAELAVEVAALLDVRNRERPVLLGRGLGAVAPRVARLSGSVEVMVLGGPAPADAVTAPDAPEVGNLTRVTGQFGDGFPFLSRRLGGVALRRPRPGEAREGARILARGGRLVGLRPDPELRGLLTELPLRELAWEERACVLSRG